jgi:hypothetical protein
MHITAHDIELPKDEHPTWYIASVKPASEESVGIVLSADPSAVYGNARTQWVWVRLSSGDLVFGVFPQDEAYMATEHDHP